MRIFLVTFSVFNIIFDFVLMLGASDWSDVSLNLILNALILIYVMLPGTRKAFGEYKQQ